MNISEVIIEEVNSENCTVQDINSGKCGDFADRVIERIPDANYVKNLEFAAHVGGGRTYMDRT